MGVRLIWLGPLTAGALALTLFSLTGVQTFFLSLLLIIPFLLLCLVVTCAHLSTVRGADRTVALAWAGSFFVALAFLPALLLLGGPTKDYARFSLWSVVNSGPYRSAEQRAEVLSHWDARGFLGMDNDVYLVSDPTDVLSGALMPGHVPTLPAAKFAAARRWSSSLHLPCEPVWVSRLRRGFYLVTTFDCELRASSSP